ncbi:hypothetical protein CVT25_010431 [Psilocybe cyanescens]|uniref:Uncharacterized protein n=1 Tax=Psilocybe cyanescens TaxID=93625 RepID=A0A409XP63_PSICY|nr:hypothetical protein CVT25_010431 [Psilocybe cyanescens]
MQFSFATIAAFFIAGAHLVGASPAPAEAATDGDLTAQAAPFGVNIGTTFNNIVAWVDGQSKCNNVVIAAKGTNPCGHSFNLNGRSFTLNGCGGPLWVTQGSSNTFWANCGSLSEGDTRQPVTLASSSHIASQEHMIKQGASSRADWAVSGSFWVMTISPPQS